VSEQKSGTAPQLPSEQAKGSEYAPELMASYARRFGLFPSHMAIRQVRSLVKSKIDTDVFAAQQNRKIAILEAKIAGLLAFVGKYARRNPDSLRQPQKRSKEN